MPNGPARGLLESEHFDAGRARAQASVFGFRESVVLRRVARFQTITLRVYSITTFPSCLMPRVRNFTMPHCGRDFDSRASSTSLSE